jgi:hypothetical protein
MRQISKDIKKLPQGLIRFAELSIFLIAIVLFLSGCENSPKFPAKFIYEVDLDNKVCGQYEVIDPVKMKVQHYRDLDISYCNGVFGFSSHEIPKVLDWGDDVRDWAKNKCK